MRTNILLAFWLLAVSYSFGQMNSYEYKREIQGTTGQWNTIEIPDIVYGKIAKDLSDIRVYGITSRNDTVEAPFIFVKNKKTFSKIHIDFNLINQSKNEKGYYFTYRVDPERTINQILLNFSQLNFDWRIKLEGSQDQKNWFTLVDNYRILSIRNDFTNYQFCKIVFSESKYNYFRMCIKANEKPRLESTVITHTDTGHGVLKNYALKHSQITQDKKRKQTVIDLELNMPVPVSCLKIRIKDKTDYYRPIVIEYLTDSFKTEKSWYYNYGVAESSDILSSLDKPEFEFSSCITNKLRVTIGNNDNQPLKFETFEVSGYQTSLIARLTVPAKYYLCYGRKSSQKPNYDLEQFRFKISERANKTTLGTEELVNSHTGSAEPLFMSKDWLWGIMALIILLLGWFTFNMMKKEE